MFHSWLRQLAKSVSFTTVHSRRKQSKKTRRFRPNLEKLEDRTVLAVSHWIGGGGSDNNWMTASNWDHLPAAGATLVFDSSTPGTTYNNFPTGTAFAGITLVNNLQYQWKLQGNSISLGGLDAIINESQIDAIGNPYSNSVQLPIKLTSDATFHGQGNSNLAIDGAIDTNGYTLTLGSATNAATYHHDIIFIAGAVTGTGGLSSPVSSFNEVVFSSTANYTGLTAINCTWLQQGGSLGGSGVDVGSTGYLTGSGSLNAPTTVESGGTILAQYALSTGSLSLKAGSIFVEDLLGTGADGYLRYYVQGLQSTVNLGGATLHVQYATPTVGDQYEILDNEGLNPIIGTFMGLPEGSPLTISGYSFQITYKGGTNHNSVVLTVVGPSGPLTYTASGSTTSETLSLDPTGKTLQLVDNANNHVLVSQPLADTTAVNITGQTNNALTIDYSNGDPLFYGTSAIPFNYNGSPDNTDTLNLTGPIDNILYDATAAHGGDLKIIDTSLQNTIASFTGLMAINLNTTVSTLGVNINDSTVQHTATFSAGTLGQDVLNLDGGLANMTFKNPTDSLEIDGSTTADTFSFSSLDSGFRANLTAYGHSGLDTTNLNLANLVVSPSSPGFVGVVVNTNAINLSGSIDVTAGRANNSGDISLTGNISLTASAVLSYSGVNDLQIGTVNLGVNTLTVSDTSATDTGSISAISGAGGLTKFGPGTLTLVAQPFQHELSRIRAVEKCLCL